MVKKVVREVIADIPKDPTTKDGSANVPIPVENRMSQFPERGCQNKE